MLSGVDWDSRMYITGLNVECYIVPEATHSEEGVWPLSRPHPFSTANFHIEVHKMWKLFLPSLPVYSNVDKTWSRSPLSDQYSMCQDVTRVQNLCQLRAITARETLALWVLIAELNS